MKITIKIFSLIDEQLSRGAVAPKSSMDHQTRSGQSSTSGGHSSRQISVNSSSLFEDVSYGQVDSEQREEFEQLLKKVNLRLCTQDSDHCILDIWYSPLGITIVSYDG